MSHKVDPKGIPIMFHDILVREGHISNYSSNMSCHRPKTHILNPNWLWQFQVIRYVHSIEYHGRVFQL